MSDTAKRIDELRLTGRLPSPSGVGLQLLRLVHGGDYETDDLVRVLRSDPALCGRIFKAANGAISSSIEPVTEIQQAVLRLGGDAVIRIGMSFSLVTAHRSGSCEAFDYQRFWSSSLLRALLVQTFSREFSIGVPSDAFLIGLFRRLGDLALAAVHPERYAEFLNSSPPSQAAARRQKEVQAFGLGADLVAAALLAEWRLPASFAGAISADSEGLSEVAPEEVPEGTPESLRLLRLAEPIVTAATAGERVEARHWRAIEEARSAEEIELPRLTTVVEGALVDWSEWCSDFRLELPEFVTFANLERHVASQAAEDGAGEGVTAPASEEEEAAPRTRVLAIDDDPFSLRILVRHLERAGYDVTEATDGEDGLVKALEIGPEIVVSDWMMPGMDGLEVCAALRRCESGRRMHIILLTGRDDEQRIIEAFDAGVNDYVTKPFKPRVLIARVRAGERTMQLKRQLDAEKSKLERAMAEMAVLNRKFREASLTDPLTGLPNRRHAMLELTEAWKGAQNGQPLCVAMLDIDHFKSVNDEHGHDVGDEVLKEVAQTAKGVMRRGEVVCRMGGEEFLAIYPRAAMAQAKVGAERLRAAIEANHIRAGSFNRNVTVSIGLAGSELGLESIDELLKAADEAVYEAKRSGRNRVCLGQSPVVGQKPVPC